MKERTFAIIVIVILFCSILLVPTQTIPIEEPKITETMGDTTNFQSKQSIEIKKINGKPVMIDIFEREQGDTKDNPSTGEGILIWECIKYKLSHPDEDVSIYMATFHFSIVASVCLDPNSVEYGQMRSLSDSDYNDNGYCRISYLLIYAAKIGIHTTAIGQTGASSYICDEKGTIKSDLDFEKYFLSHLNDDCIHGYTHDDAKVNEYLTFKKAKWVSYGDKSATDMMHLKICAVSNYQDINGKVCGPGLYLSSTNLDAINYDGTNVNDNLQTGVIVSNHDDLFRITANYFSIMVRYCEQDDIYTFRNLINSMNKEQVDLLKNGNTINLDEQIVYLGSEDDELFEFYFTPLGGNTLSWEATYDPCCKFIGDLKNNSNNGHIIFAWTNPNFDYFQKSNKMMNALIEMFHQNPDYNNRLFLHLDGSDVSAFNDLYVGFNIGYKNLHADKGYHSKDMQMSYVKNECRQYISLLMTSNYHAGGNTYQVNTILVIKETDATNHLFFDSFGKNTTYGCIGDYKDSSNKVNSVYYSKEES